MNTNRWSGVSSEEVPAGRSPVASCRGAGTQHRGVGRAGSPWVVQGRGSQLAREEPSPLGSCWGRKKWDRGTGEVVLQLGVEGSCENISITSVPRWGMPMSMFWCLGRQQSVAASCSIPSWATSSLHCITKHTDKCFFFFFPDHRATRPLSPSHELPLLAHTPASPYQQGGAGATRQLQPRLFAAFWHWVEMPRHWVPCPCHPPTP